MNRKTAELPKNLKAEKATHTFQISFRDRDHFYRVVHWLNDNVGRGSDKWTIEGRVRRLLESGQTNVVRKVYIFTENFDPQSTLYLNLV